MELKKLTKYLQLDEDRLLSVLHKELLLMDYTLTVNEDLEYIYGVPNGDSLPVMLVAHVDTVHKNKPSLVYHDTEHNVMWSPGGLGADDRAGVFAVMEIAKKFRVSVLFTDGEESGGIGAKAFIKDHPDNVNRYAMLIQLDRRNFNDAVYYRNDAKDFQSYIEDFGFKCATGSFSDISTIAPAWKVNSVNLSIGYIDEHRDTEHLHVDRMVETIDKVSEILSREIPVFEYKEKSYTSYAWKRDDKDDNWAAEWTDRYYNTGKVAKMDDYRKPKDAEYEPALDCSICGAFVMFEDEIWTSENEMLCPECFTYMAGYTCDICKIACLPDDAEHLEASDLQVCNDCFIDVFLEEVENSDIDKEEKA